MPAHRVVDDYDDLVRASVGWPPGKWYESPDADSIAHDICVRTLACDGPVDRIIIGCVPATTLPAVKLAGYRLAVVRVTPSLLTARLSSRTSVAQPGPEVVTVMMASQELATQVAEVTFSSFEQIYQLAPGRWFVWAASGAGKTHYVRALHPRRCTTVRAITAEVTAVFHILVDNFSATFLHPMDSVHWFGPKLHTWYIAVRQAIGLRYDLLDNPLSARSYRFAPSYPPAAILGQAGHPVREWVRSPRFSLLRTAWCAAKLMPFVALVCYICGARGLFSLLPLVYLAFTRRPLRTPFPVAEHVVLRQDFRQLRVLPTKSVASLHSHPGPASERNAADDTINSFITMHGYDVYSVQQSQRDVERQFSGSHTHYWPVDRVVPEHSDDIVPTHVVKLLNVDYYIDWVAYLWMAQPFMLFTFTPQDPSGESDGIQWTTNDDNTISMRITGGATYRHQLWDYDVDIAEARYRGFAVTYTVDRVAVSEHWSIVLLTPRSVDPYSGPIGCTLRRAVLARNALCLDGTTRLCAAIRCSGPEPFLSVCIPGTYASVRVPSTTEAILRGRCALGPSAYADLTSVLGKEYPDGLALAHAVIFAAFPVDKVGAACSSKLTVADSAIHYRTLAVGLPTTDDKPMGAVIAPPIIPSGYLPYRGLCADVWTVTERIAVVHNDQEVLPPKYLGFAAEFARSLIPKAHSIAPIRVYDVIVAQTRPSQRAKNKVAAKKLSHFLSKPSITISSFQKGEVYSTLKDPRNISTLPAEHCLIYSQYTRPFSDHLKTTAWYAFGMHPRKVAARVVHLARNSEEVIETDFSRFDGTHSQGLYHLELALLLRAFPVDEHATIRTIHQQMVSAKAWTKHGCDYEMGGSRASGSADTSLFNSIDNAFVAYSAFRNAGKKPDEAYAALGLYGGDDGITPDLDCKVYESTAADLQLRLKATVHPAYARTSMLGRIYPAPADGPQHMADLPRQLAKLHVCASRDPQVWKTIVADRARGILAWDPDTPVLSHWARLALRTHDSHAPIRDREAEFKVSQMAAFLADGHITDTPCERIMYAEAATSLGLPEFQIREYCAMLDAATTFVYPPLHIPPPPVLTPGVAMGNQYSPPGPTLGQAAMLSVISDSKREPLAPIVIVPNARPQPHETKTLIAAQPSIVTTKRVPIEAIIAGTVKPVGLVSWAFSALKPCIDCSGPLTITPAQLLRLSHMPKAVPPKRCKKCKGDRQKRIADYAAESPGL
jgi:hypothetical protein